jgi:hypothetical protein
MTTTPREAFRLVLVGMHLLLAGTVLIGMILDPREFTGIGSVAFLVLIGIVWALVTRSRVVILPAILLTVASTLMTAVIMIGSIAWPESVVTRFFLGWVLFCGLELSVIVMAVGHSSPKNAQPDFNSPAT